MSMPMPSTTWTAEMVRALPDDGLRHDIIDGEHVVTLVPTFRHQAAEISDLLLVIEVLSPSTARVDRGRKRLRYTRSNVAEYWIVDVDSQVVECWLPGEARPESLRESLTWQPDSACPPLALDLPAFVAGVTGGS
jgi:Uma2 family endonuclease